MQFGLEDRKGAHVRTLGFVTDRLWRSTTLNSSAVHAEHTGGGRDGRFALSGEQESGRKLFVIEVSAASLVRCHVKLARRQARQCGALQ